MISLTTAALQTGSRVASAYAEARAAAAPSPAGAAPAQGVSAAARVRIPTNPAGASDRNQPPVPSEASRAFR